jgi:hypothetical protein
MADVEMGSAEMVDAGAAGGADEHPAGRVIGTTGYITTGKGFTPEDDPGNPTAGIRLMTAEETEAWEGKVAPSEPEDQRCRQVKENGFRCRHIPAAGETFCHQHRRYRATHADRAIDVPLLEDAPSIRLVISQTVRTMAGGDLPPANGRVMIAGCRVALNLLQFELARARLAEKTAARLERAQARVGARVAARQEAREAVAESDRSAVAPVAGPAAELVAAPLAVPVAAPVAVPVAVGIRSGWPEPMERENAERVSAVVTDEERAQGVLAALDAMEESGEPEDAVLTAGATGGEGGEAMGRRRRAGALFTEEDLAKQWDLAIGRPFRRPWKRTYSWEKKPEWKLSWPRPGR